MNPEPFDLPFGHYLLKGDSYRMGGNCIVLHGAGQSSRERFTRLRKWLQSQGLSSSSFDFIGHGDTGGDILDTTLHNRTEQAAAVVRHACSEPLTLIAASMAGYTAIKLTEIFSVNNLVLLVPAVYTPRAYDIFFGTEFSAAIRAPGSWQDSDAFPIMSQFKGNLLIVAAEIDEVIPEAVIQGIYTAADSARSREIHVVPNSRHDCLFPTELDFHVAMAKIRDLCLV